MAQHIALTLSLILAAAALSQWVAWKARLPGIVFLLAAGIAAGPGLGLINPEALMGELFFPFVSLSVALILFEGSLTLKFSEIKGLETVVRNMISFGMVITWLITAVATWFFIGVSWQIALLLGAITSVSGPTVIMPMLRTVRPTRSVSNILRWEGILIDPIGAALAVLVYEFIIAGTGQGAAHTFLTLGKLMVTGGLFGALAGWSFGMAIRHLWLPHFLHSLGAMAVVLLSFALSNTLVPESGLVTVTVMGIWLANMKDVAVEEILDFKENISLVLISLLFILLAARLDLNALADLGWGAAGLFVAIQFLARPLNAMASCLGSGLSWPERHMLAWIAPRGIVAAAISALFSVQLEKAGVADAQVLVSLTFFIIIATVIFQSITARPIARLLKVAEPEPTGFLIIGANAVARAVGTALAGLKIPVLLADPGWDNISKAKGAGLPAYFGNPASEHAKRHMDLTGIGNVLSLSPHENVNAAAALHFKTEMGPAAVFSVRPPETRAMADRLRTSHPAVPLFPSQATFPVLASRLAKGAELKATTLTAQFDLTALMAQGTPLPLFIVNPEGRIRPITDKAPQAGPGWTVLYLSDPDHSAKEDKG